MPCSSPLDSPSLNAKVVDRSMPITFGLRSSITCLSACHCSSPQSSACRPPTAADDRLHRASRVEDPALRRSAERDAFDARRRRRARLRPRTCRRTRRSCGGARRTFRARRSTRTPDPRCTRASARPRSRCRACASARAGMCRAASSATAAGSACSRRLPNGRSAAGSAAGASFACHDLMASVVRCS